jgi:hypothetical membrane protein
VLFTTVVVLCAALRPGYSHLSQFMSELGATGTPNAALMNVAGFIPTGLLIAAFGVALTRSLGSGVRSLLAGALVTLFGVGVFLAGIFSCDAGCPTGPGTTLEARTHDAVSIPAFISAILGIGLWGFEFRRRPGWDRIWKYSAASSAAAAVCLVATASSIDGRVLTGLWQRLLLGTLFVWYAVIAVRLYTGAWTSASLPRRGAADKIKPVGA